MCPRHHEALRSSHETGLGTSRREDETDFLLCVRQAAKVFGFDLALRVSGFCRRIFRDRAIATPSLKARRPRSESSDCRASFDHSLRAHAI
jgi:hypothetical protein